MQDLNKVRSESASEVSESEVLMHIRKLIRPMVRAAEPMALGVSRKGIAEWQYWPQVKVAALIDMYERRITVTQARAILVAYDAALKHFEERRQWPGYDHLDKILNELREQTPRVPEKGTTALGRKIQIPVWVWFFLLPIVVFVSFQFKSGQKPGDDSYLCNIYSYREQLIRLDIRNQTNNEDLRFLIRGKYTNEAVRKLFMAIPLSKVEAQRKVDLAFIRDTERQTGYPESCPGQ